jgi:hypothetical protein
MPVKRIDINQTNHLGTLFTPAMDAHRRQSCNAMHHIVDTHFFSRHPDLFRTVGFPNADRMLTMEDRESRRPAEMSGSPQPEFFFGTLAYGMVSSAFYPVAGTLERVHGKAVQR